MSAPGTVSQTLIAALGNILGADNVRSDPELLQSHGQDWTRFYAPAPAAVVFPRTVEQVQALVRYAADVGLGLVPSGGRTGLSGGAVAMNGEVVVSLDKMDRILDYSETDSTVTLQAGVITAGLQAFAESRGRQYPVDFASSGSSQIGGNIATNAGGIKVLRYGLTRDQVTGLKVVTGSGQLLELNRGLIKNATGYDLRHLFIGSEGTLGIIVEATLKLAPPERDPGVVLLAVPGMQDIIAILCAFRERLPLTAFEFFSEQALGHVLAHGDRPHPFQTPSPFYVLLEFEESSGAALEPLMEIYEDCLAAGWMTDAVISQSEQQRRDIWSYRERISESITPYTPYKNDVAVLPSKVPAFLAEVETLVVREYPEFEIVWFGHIGDGNLHLNILKPADWEVATFKTECERVSQLVLGVVSRFGGSVSAEHGVGLLKRDQISFSRSAEELALMKSIKQLFDPAGIMNPGKLLG